jgi:predicted SAM-dependent methyltransferase
MKLDIGCGQNQQKPLEEWTHLDGTTGEHIEIVCDWTQIPLPNASVEEMHFGDVIEHIPCWLHNETLGEWNRLLKKGGVFHGAMPNLDRIMKDYADGTHPLQDAINGLYGWADSKFQQHYMTYTKETLTKLMAKYGFAIDDFSESPGPKDRPWWLVFRGHKTADVEQFWRKYDEH